ncbi:MAG TPA: peroxide stress protein YaaA [Paenalcaligenes sp.]|nr:peroxide stress protein YaaA [Paenalcaligenes sp.]
MLFLLSPAKKLDYESTVRTTLKSQPLFVPQAEELVDILKKYSQDDIAQLMKLSDNLAELNVQRFQEWVPEFTLDNARQAVLAFNGDVYEGLDAPSLSDEQLEWAQQHLIILSGLYGALRPLDLMQPYRLEMGTRLQTPKGKNLYEFWGTQIAEYLNEQLDQAHDESVIINLASVEYFKSVDRKTLKAPVVECVFQDERKGKWRVISFYAKKARGLMMRYAIDEGVTTVEGLKDFNGEGYRYDAEASTEQRLVFRRPEA